MTNLKYICSTSIHESALKNDILKSRSRKKDKHWQSSFLLCLFLKRILRHWNIWPKWTKSLAFQVWFLDWEQSPGSLLDMQNLRPLRHQNQHLHTPPKGFLGTIKSEMLWAIFNTVKKTQLLFLFSFKSFPQPSPSFRLRLTDSPILPQILLLWRNL